MTLSRFHFWFGVFGIVVFLLTGQYMEIVHQHLENMADKPRMYFRSAHMYLLLCSLLNLLLGVYYKPSLKVYVRYLQYLISLLLVIAWSAYLAGFFLEYAYAMDPEKGFLRPFTGNASYLLMAVGVLLCFQAFFDSDEPENVSITEA